MNKNPIGSYSNPIGLILQDISVLSYKSIPIEIL